MSLYKKITGRSWAKDRGTAMIVGGAIAGAITGGIATAGIGMAGVLAGAGLGSAAGGAYAQGDAQRQQEKASRAAAREAEEMAKSGKTVENAEAAAQVDTAGNESARRKKQAMAASAGTGRNGTNITSSLGGSGMLG